MPLIASAADATGLRVFFSLLLVLVLAAGFYAFFHRKQFSVITVARETRMPPPIFGCGWSFSSGSMPVIITALMIFEV